MSKVIMTSEQLVERLEILANRPSFYKNKYPYNLCYNNPDGRTSADCVNLYKALLNGYDVNNRTVGYYQKNLTNTGDCTEWGLLSQCSDISGDFTKLQPGFPRILYMSGHIGGYIGEEVMRGGHIYNVIECTGAWERGILYSWVDADGTRRRWKGGSASAKWTKHGLMTPWVKYPEIKTEKKTNAEIAREVIDGKWGNGIERKTRLQSAGYNYTEIQSLVNQLLNPTSAMYYVVKKNDNLTKIANKYKLTVEELLALNPTIKNKNLIRVGQKVRVK